MVILRDISRHIIVADEPIRAALARIEANEDGTVFCVSPEGVLEGVLTDGDFRRWVVQAAAPDLSQPVSTIANKSFVSCPAVDGEEKVARLLSDSIRFVPLVDAQKRLVGVARARRDDFAIEGRKIGGGAPVFIIAEIGNNHNGSLELAKRLVDEAVAAGADCAKFQMRDLASLYRNAGDANDAREDLGSQYTLDLLSKFQLPQDDLFRAFDYCRERGILPLCTPWDPESLAALERYGLGGYKAASADLTNHDFLEALARTGKPLICSTGMSTEDEIQGAVGLLKRRGAQFALLHCNSTYPAPFKDLNLRYIDRLRRTAQCPVGYSSHDRGINIAVAAVSLGAAIVEKHFTLDRAMEGNDHRVSLLPLEFSALVGAVREVESALGQDADRRLSQGELMNRESLGKSLVVNRDLAAGEVVTAAMVEARSPGQGLPPYRKKDLVGKVARRALKKGDLFFPSDIGEGKAVRRSYRFRRPFGIPVRYHDLGGLTESADFGLLEFHLSYKDLDEDFSRYLTRDYAADLVVHAPELFAGDHILDLCAPDPAYRARSSAELAKVVALTRRLKARFPKTQRPRIVVNVGGFTQDAHLDAAERARRYALVAESLGRLDLSGVEVIPQTMPPFPWHFGGQRFQNLFMRPDEIAAFCRAHGMRVCLDVSHSQLACNHFKWSFRDFLREVGPFTTHLHVADASGVDGEGLQVGEGTVDFPSVCESLNAYCPDASFIPEIWQGHKNGGEGFWIAFERLEGAL